MSIPAIQSVLAQMRVTAVQTGIAAPVAHASQASGFGTALKRSLDAVSGAQEAAYAQARDFEAGKPGVALNDVMIDLQKANIGFQTVIQVRNRLVAAYQEIMNLPA